MRLYRCVGMTIAAAAVVCFAGCRSRLPERSGFLSDYSSLEKVEHNRMSYVSDDLAAFDAFIIDPVEFRFEGQLTLEHRAELANHMREKLTDELRKIGVPVVDASGTDVARVRIALTDIDKSKWYLNLHPVTKASGVGLGGASMEAEIVDSVTGRQLAALIRSDRGSRIELDMFSTLDDARDAIDKWARQAASRVAELRSRDASTGAVSP